jgi:error-prone DNA polymerase
MWNIPPDDPAVYEMLQRADTVGVFQVESRAQMATLPRLKPAKFYDLVVEVALIRPGPIVGQMVHPYLDRRAGRADIVYPHPSLEPILARTLGVPLFQEQLLRIAMVAAGFTGGQAEELRRAMGFKRSEKRMKAIEGQLREGMARQGITGEAADAIVKSIAAFALYGFPESHAASFALIVYASAYLKAYFPAAFYAALLNNQPMGFYHPATLVKDAQRHGVRFAPVDVQHSRWECEVEEDGTVRIGLRYVAGLRRHVGEAIEGARVTTPPVRFRSLEDFVRRTGANKEELAVLAEVGALNAFGYHRREALWQIEKAVRPAGEMFEETGTGGWGLGAGNQAQEAAVGDWQLNRQASEIQPFVSGPQSPVPSLQPPACPLPPMSPTERLVADYAGTRLTIGPHPMALRRRELALRGVLRAIDLPRERQGRRIRVAGTVITRQRPGTAKGFVFLTLEDETGISNIIVRPDLFARDRLAILEEPFLLIEGLLQNQEGVTAVRAERVEGIAGVPIDIESHDFY